MSERRVVDCDGCGAKAIREPQRLFVDTNRAMDPSGNGYSNEGSDLDLCPACLAWLALECLGVIGDWDKNKAILRKLRERCRALQRKGDTTIVT